MGKLATNAPELKSASCFVLSLAEDEADRKAIRDRMSDASYSQRRIAKWLGISSSTIAQHRATNCECCHG